MLIKFCLQLCVVSNRYGVINADMGAQMETNCAAGSSAMQVDYLIVGTGPAGASLAAFMASYGTFAR